MIRFKSLALAVPRKSDGQNQNHCLLAATMQPFFSAWSTACTGAAAVFCVKRGELN
jgi:hypothetical protein